MSTIVFTMDARNNIGHPTMRNKMIRKYLKTGQAKIVKRFGQTILIQFLNKVFDKSKTIECEFRVGVDPGYTHIGFSVFKIYKHTVIKLIDGEVETRTSEITKNLSERAMYRRTRRRFRRKNVKRKFGHVKFRKPIWKNRRKHMFQPTHKHLILTHTNLLHKIFSLIPLDQGKLHIEYATFDFQKMKNSNIKSYQYSKGIQYGFENVKTYVRTRDKYTCQMCKKKNKNIKLDVHHIIKRSNGGSDRPDNLITLCETCHKSKIHRSGLKSPFIKSISNINYRSAGVINSCMKYMYNYISNIICTQWTYGYVVKAVRFAYNIEKTHSNDANVIAFSDHHELQPVQGNYVWNESKSVSINFKQYRRHVRTFTQRHEDRKYHIYDPGNPTKRKTVAWNRNRRCEQDKKKPSLTEYKKINPKAILSVYRGTGKKGSTGNLGGPVRRRNNTDMLYRPGDLIMNNSARDVCRGWESTHSIVCGMKFPKIKIKQCRRVLNNSGLVCIN